MSTVSTLTTRQRREITTLPTCGHVLAYLKLMAEYCKAEHRPILENEYNDAWRFAAEKIFGKLPPSPSPKDSFYIGFVQEEKRPPTKQEQLRKLAPSRHIAKTVKDRAGEWDVLEECGHRVPSMRSIGVIQKRRLCFACVTTKKRGAA